MLPTIATGNVASAIGGAYEVANSCRFNKVDNAYHSKSLGTPTDADKFTISFWMKRSEIGVAQHTGLKTAATAGSAGGYIGTNDQLYFYYEYY